MATLVVTVDRAALFADSRYWVQAEAELRRQRHRAGEDPDRQLATATSTGWRATSLPVRRWRSTARCSAWPRRKALRSALDAAGVRLRTDLDLLADDLARPPGAAARSRSTNTARRKPPPRARDKLARCARRWRATARRITSSRPSTTSRGSPTCAAPTSSYNPVFLAHLLLDVDGAHAVRRRRQDRRRAAARSRRRRPAPRALRRGRRRARGAAATAACCWSTRSASRSACANASPPACAVVEAINPSTLAKSRKSAAEAALRARGDGRGRRRDVRVLRLVRGRAGARRARHRADGRRKAHRPSARSAAGFVGLRSTPSPASTPTARCRITAPPTSRTR